MSLDPNLDAVLAGTASQLEELRAELLRQAHNPLWTDDQGHTFSDVFARVEDTQASLEKLMTAIYARRVA